MDRDIKWLCYVVNFIAHIDIQGGPKKNNTETNQNDTDT